MNETNACSWIGDGECCTKPAFQGRSYCETHHRRMYITLLPEMADYVIQKQLNGPNTDIQQTDWKTKPLSNLSERE